jgi:hypothetical protein
MLTPRTLLAVTGVIATLGGCVTTATPVSTPARTDAEYCAQLVYLFQRYLSNGEFGGRRAGGDADLESRVAVAKCEQGDSAAGIPVLERKLINNGFTLPKRN